MKILKIIGIVFLSIFVLITTFFTLFFLFGEDCYGIETLKSIFEDGFGNGIKTFFVEIWRGIKSLI